MSQARLALTEAESSVILPPRGLGTLSSQEYRSVVDGAIVGQTSEANPLKCSTYLFTPGAFPGDFDLRVKFNLLSGNSGVQYRSRQQPDYQVAGYQADTVHRHPVRGGGADVCRPPGADPGVRRAGQGDG